MHLQSWVYEGQKVEKVAFSRQSGIGKPALLLQNIPFYRRLRTMIKYFIISHNLKKVQMLNM